GRPDGLPAAGPTLRATRCQHVLVSLALASGRRFTPVVHARNHRLPEPAPRPSPALHRSTICCRSVAVKEQGLHRLPAGCFGELSKVSRERASRALMEAYAGKQLGGDRSTPPSDG